MTQKALASAGAFFNEAAPDGANEAADANEKMKTLPVVADEVTRRLRFIRECSERHH